MTLYEGKIRHDNPRSGYWVYRATRQNIKRIHGRIQDAPENTTHRRVGERIMRQVKAESDRRKGERLLLNKANWLGRRAEELLADYEELRPQHTLRTYEDVEKLWEQHVAPHLKDFASMQDLSRGQEPVPEDSVWYANWRVPKRRT